MCVVPAGDRAAAQSEVYPLIPEMTTPWIKSL